MSFEKPMTDNQKFYGNKLYKFLKENGTVTKEQMLNALGWDSSKDRQLRDLISLIAKKVPVVSVSSNRGYRLIKPQMSKIDIRDLIHQNIENEKRANEILVRNKPIMTYIESYMKTNGIGSLAELNRILGEQND